MKEKEKQIKKKNNKDLTSRELFEGLMSEIRDIQGVLTFLNNNILENRRRIDVIGNMIYGQLSPTEEEFEDVKKGKQSSPIRAEKKKETNVEAKIDGE